MRKITIILPIFILTIICIFFLLFILFEKDPNDPPSALINKRKNKHIIVKTNNGINKDSFFIFLEQQ